MSKKKQASGHNMVPISCKASIQTNRNFFLGLFMFESSRAKCQNFPRFSDLGIKAVILVKVLSVCQGLGS